MMHRLAVLALALSFAHPVAAQHADILVWSTESGGGALTVSRDENEIIRLFENICAGGQCLFSNPDPGFNQQTRDRPQDSLYVLGAGTIVSIELIAIDSGLSIKFGDTTLRAPGDSVRLGTAPNIHLHPSWQLLAPSGDVRTVSATYRLRANATYAASAPIRMQFRNGPVVAEPTATATTAVAAATASPTPTATAVTTPTPTATPSPSSTSTATATMAATPAAVCTGDCDGDGQVTVDELVTGINVALGNLAMAECVPFDANDDAMVTVDEIVRAVNAGLGGCP